MSPWSPKTGVGIHKTKLDLRSTGFDIVTDKVVWYLSSKTGDTKTSTKEETDIVGKEREEKTDTFGEGSYRSVHNGVTTFTRD